MKSIRLTKKLKTAIIEHAKESYPKESCGVVVDNVYIPCNNLSIMLDQFYIDPVDLVRAESIGTIQAYVHSHPDGSCEASEPDRVGIVRHNKPWLICSYEPNTESQIALYKPDNFVSPLIGRSYFHGLQDCYSMIKDYYYRELNITLNDYDRSDKWWEDNTTKSLYIDNFEKEGFVEVKDGIRKHDVILFKLGKTFHTNHAGIFLGDGNLVSEEAPKVIGNSLFIHHPYNRISIREIYGEAWSNRTSVVLRHKEFL